MVRLFHFSDTHLGHQQYPRTAPSGLNQREEDLIAAFHRVIEAAVAERPDLVIHAGDLFDGVRPTNRALAVALEGFLRLSKAGIPAVVIAGNHEHPKLRETGSPLRLLAHLDSIHVAYQGRRETFEILAPDGPLRVHAVPQCPDGEALAAEVAAAPARGDGRDILVLHGAVHSLPAFSHAEFNELSLDPAWFDARFAYVALGHYHGATQVNPRAWYSGAPERVSMAESGEEKGFLDVRLGAGDPDVRFRPLSARPYADLPTLDATGLGAGEVRDAAVEALARVPEGAVARLRVENLDPALRGILDLRAIGKAAGHALHLDLRLGWRDHAESIRGEESFGALGDEFAAFLSAQPLEGVDRSAVLARARGLLEASP